MQAAASCRAQQHQQQHHHQHQHHQQHHVGLSLHAPPAVWLQRRPRTTAEAVAAAAAAAAAAALPAVHQQQPPHQQHAPSPQQAPGISLSFRQQLLQRMSLRQQQQAQQQQQQQPQHIADALMPPLQLEQQPRAAAAVMARGPAASTQMGRLRASRQQASTAAAQAAAAGARTRIEASPPTPDVAAADHQQQQQQHQHDEQQQQQQQVLPEQGPAGSAAQAQAAPQQQQQQHESNEQQPQQVVDPSSLPITARVRVLLGNAAARRTTTTAPATAAAASAAPHHSRGAPKAAVPRGALLGVCTAAGLSAAAAEHVLAHVLRQRVSTAPEQLEPFLVAYLRLAAAYGEPVVLEWLRRAPPVIRAADEVPGRLQQLQQLLGDASLPEALALTRRCPMVLGVSSELLAARMQALCQLMGRPGQGPSFLAAAPALLAMQPHTLSAKQAHLAALAESHPEWQRTFAALPPKSLAVLLTYSLDRHARLRHVADQGQQARLCMTTIMAWSKRRMLEEFPQFDG